MALRKKAETRQARRRILRENANQAPQMSHRDAPGRAAQSGGWLRHLGHLYGLDSVRSHGRVTWTLALGTVVSYVGRGAVMPFVALYLTLVKGAISLTYAGVGIALEQTLRALLSPVFGSLSDRFGRKPFIIAGLTLQSLTIPAYVLVDGPASYLLVSALAGLGQAPYQPVLNALLTDLTPKERRVGVFGLVHMMKNLGYGLGVVAGGLLVHQGYGLLFLAGGVFPLTYALVILLAVREPARKRPAPARKHPAVSVLDAVRAPRFGAFLAVATLTFVSWGAAEHLLPVYIKDAQGLGLDETWVTRAFALNSLLIVLLQVPVSERLATRISRTRGLALASLVTAAAYVLLGACLGLVTTHPELACGGLLLATAVLTLAEMLDTPLLFALAADLAPTDMTGGAMGVLSLAAPMGLATPLLLAGVLRELGGWPLAWSAFTGILLLGAAGYLLLQDGKPAPGPARSRAPRRAAARTR